MLFMLVILFPGYSQNACKKTAAKSTVALLKTATERVTGLEAMFKKCLSCGVANNGPVTEETPSSSTSEERADHGVGASIDEYALSDCLIRFNLQYVVLCFMYEQRMPSITVVDITTPPPDSILS